MQHVWSMFLHETQKFDKNRL